MPTIRAVTTILRKAGFVESKPVAQRNGQKAHNLSGFRVALAAADRRVAFVYHVGRHTLTNLQRYAGALSEAGLVVTRRHGGLQVTSTRAVSQRGLGH